MTGAAASSPVTIAFIGFGEVGQTFARSLLASGGIRVSAHDTLFGTQAGLPLENAARALHVRACRSLGPALTGASIIYSCVTASATEDVARAAAAFIEQGQLFVDLNSAAPATKQRAAAAIETAGGRYLEAAVMAPVLRPGLAVPILAGGPHAAIESPRLNRLGMQVTPVSDQFGRASSMKLCRSIIIKGLEALMVDCAAASEAAGVKDEVFASLAETFPSIDLHALADAMTERVATHGVRRATEMREGGEMLAALGLNPALALAVADAQARGARPRAAT